MRENDYFLNQLTNPDFSENDFRNIGLTTDNTSIEDRDTYKSLDFIQSNPLFQTDGAFDEAKFDRFYNYSLYSYNQFANSEATEQIAKQDFFRDDIYASYDERTQQEETYITREANPLRQRKGLIHANDVQESPMSIREIAQTQKVWDEATQSWQDAPNESFFENFFETRVLAQYDEDGEHLDPFSGRMVKHKKGEKKINENGTFYYENLNGRDVYGREVLSKFDTLTTDGSFVNKFDFFDSDDKEKSFVGTLVRNATKVVPAFIPGVAPWYVGARVALNTVDMLSKLGKIFTGSDNPTLKGLEGFTSSLAFSSSDYAQGSSEADIPAHAWSIENLLNIGADTFTQLAEQRWIFKYVPSIIKGKAGWDQDAADKLVKETIASKKKEIDGLINKKLLTAVEEGKLAKFKAELEGLQVLASQNIMKDYMKDYQKIGKYISQSYMTGITVADAYNEAKAEGASDMEAAMLTLGYAIGEYGIINSDLGQWILPELKAEKQTFRNIAKKLYEIPKPEVGATIKKKTNFLKSVFDLGKKLAENDYAYFGSSIGKSMLAGAAAEGVEEVSEEALYDVSKAIFNTINYLRGDTTQLTTFNDIGNRYGLSFVGGAIGGSLGSLQTDYQQAKQQKTWTRDQAWQELVHIVKEGEGDKFLDVVNKMTWASGDLSNVDFEDADGQRLYKKGSTKDNQNQAVKDAMTEQVKMITDILNANGGKVDDASLLNILTNSDKDFRFLSLQKSTFAAQYLQHLNDIDTAIVKKVAEIKSLETDKKIDSDKSEEDKNNKEQKSILQKELKQLLEDKQNLISGKRSGEYIEKALFEMSEDISNAFMAVSFVAYAEAKEGKKLNEIPQDRLKILQQEWKDYSKGSRKDDLETAFRIFKHINLLTSGALQNYDAKYFGEATSNNLLADLETIFGQRAYKLQMQEDDEVLGLAEAQHGVGNKFNILESPMTIFTSIAINKIQDKDLREQLLERFDVAGQDEDAVMQEENIVAILSEVLEQPGVLESIEQDIDKLPYVNYATRQAIKSLFNIDWYYQDVLEEPFKAKPKIMQILAKLDKKPYSPILELLNNFAASIGNNDINVATLVQELENKFTIQAADNKIEEFDMGEDTQQRLDSVLQNIKLLKASILAARTDGVDLGNIVGYNATSNELLKSNLAQIDKNNANVILQDLATLENKLKYYAKIHELNSGQKLLEHDKASVNSDIIIYNKFKKFVLESNWPPLGWEGRDELKKAIQDIELLGTLTGDDGKRNLSLNNDQKIQQKKDSLKMRQAIHDFFAKNANNLNDENKLAELFSGDLFDFESLDTSILNHQTQDISDSSFLSYIAASAALAPNDFYKLYKGRITSKIAPVIGQEQATYIALAHLTNGAVMSKFAKAKNLALQKKIASYSKEDFKKKFTDNKRLIIQDDYLDSDIAINFFRTLLIEGIAGSGKSSGVLKPLIQMLRTIEGGQKLLDGLYIVNTSKERAMELAESLGLEGFQDRCFSREEFLEKIAPGVNKIRKIVDNKLQLEKSDLVQREGESLYRYNVSINKNDAPPTMVILDEISGFSQQDLLLMDEHAEYHGYSNIGLGDFDQDGLEGGIKNDDNYTSEVFSDNFMHSVKLGSSFRSENGLKDFNQNAIRGNLRNLLSRDNEVVEKAPEMFFRYYEDENQILGDKVYGTQPMSEIFADIDKVLKSLEDGEMLGFIFNDKDSEIYKYMHDINESGAYKGRIDFKEGSTSQGEERNFYVVDLNQAKLPRHSKFWKQVYTGITRAKKGTLIRLQGTTKLQALKPDPVVNDSSLKDNVIEKYGLGVKKILDEIVTEGNDITIKPFKGTKPQQQKQNTVTINGKEYKDISSIISNPPLAIGQEFVLDDETYEVATYLQDASGIQYIHYKQGSTDIVEKLDSFKDNLSKIKPTQSPLSDDEKEMRENIDKRNATKMDIDNSNPNELVTLLHSFATEEVGLEFDTNKNVYKKPANYDSRNDSLIGIIKYLESKGEKYFDDKGVLIPAKVEPLLKKLRKIRSACLYKKNKSDIIAVIQRELGINKSDDVQVRFAFASYHVNEDETDMNGQDPFYHSLFKTIKERVLGIFSKNKNKLKPTNKSISIVVTRKDKDGKRVNLTTLPLLNLTNPLTLMTSNSKGLEDIKTAAEKIIADIKAEGKPLKGLEVLDKLRESLVAMNSPKAKQFIKLIDVYKLVLPGKMLFLDEFSDNSSLYDLVGTNLEATGPIVTTGEKGSEFFDEDRQYDGEWMELEDYKNGSGKYVTNVLTSPKDIYDETGNRIIVHKGSGFVLVTEAVSELPNNQNVLIEQFFKQERDPNLPKLVKLVYVSPPRSSIVDYFKNLNKVYKKKDGEEVDTQLGTVLSNFRILEKLLSNDILLSDLPQSNSLKYFTEKYKKFKDVISKIQDKFGNDSTALKDFLEGVDGAEGIPSLEEFSASVSSVGKSTGVKSWKSYIQNYLRDLVLSDVDAQGKTVYVNFYELDNPKTEVQNKIKNKIETVSEFLKDNGIPGIFYHLNLKPNVVLAEGLTELDTNGTFRGSSLLINGKIDSQAFKGDIVPLLDKLLKMVYTKGLDKAHLATYLNESYSEQEEDEKQKQEEEKKQIKDFIDYANRVFWYGSNSDQIKQVVADYITSQKGVTTIGSIMQHLNSLGYITIQQAGGSNYFVAKVEDPYKLIEADTVEFNGVTYKFTGFNQEKAEFSPIVSQQSEGFNVNSDVVMTVSDLDNLSVTQQKLLLQVLKGAIFADGTKYEKSVSLLRIDSINDVKALCNNIMFKKIFEELHGLNTDNVAQSFGEPGMYLFEMLKSIILQKPVNKPQEEQDNKPCPITIY